MPGPVLLGSLVFNTPPIRLCCGIWAWPTADGDTLRCIKPDLKKRGKCTITKYRVWKCIFNPYLPWPRITASPIPSHSWANGGRCRTSLLTQTLQRFVNVFTITSWTYTPWFTEQTNSAFKTKSKPNPKKKTHLARVRLTTQKKPQNEKYKRFAKEPRKIPLFRCRP